MNTASSGLVERPRGSVDGENGSQILTHLLELQKLEESREDGEYSGTQVLPTGNNPPPYYSEVDDEPRYPAFGSHTDLQSMIDNYKKHVESRSRQAPAENARQMGATLSFAHPQPEYFVYSSAGQNHVPSMMSHSQPCLYSGSPAQPQMRRAPPPPYNRPIQSQQQPHGNKATNIGRSNAAWVPNTIGEAQAGEQQISVQSPQAAHDSHSEWRTEQLHKLEAAYRRLEQEFERLLVQRQKESEMEDSIAQKAREQVEKLRLENRNLHAQLEQQLGAGASSRESDEEHHRQLQQLRSILSSVTAKNKDLTLLQEQQKLQMDSQSTTVEEQKKHIEVLEKACANAQLRISARDRQAMDMAAVTERCSQLQRMLDEAVKENLQLKHGERHKAYGAANNMAAPTELLLMRKHSAPSPSGPGIGRVEPKEQEMALHNKDVRILELEHEVQEVRLQLTHDLELKREAESVLNTRVLTLEREKMDFERRIQELVEEKLRSHAEWADERRCLNQRIRLLEQELKEAAISKGQQTLADYAPPTAEELIAEKMEEMKKKIEERRNTITPRQPAPMSSSPDESKASANSSCSDSNFKLLLNPGHIATIQVNQVSRIAYNTKPSAPTPLASYIETLTSGARVK